MSLSQSPYLLYPPGILGLFPLVKIPAGWLECNGQAVSRSRYNSLFLSIGSTFGVGDGSTTFNLPTIRRRFLWGRGGPYTLNQPYGQETIVLGVNHIPSHTHSTGVDSADHYHDGFTSVSGEHSHGIEISGETNFTGTANRLMEGGFEAFDAGAGNHAHAFFTSTQDTSHNHPIPFQGEGQPISILNSYFALVVCIHW